MKDGHYEVFGNCVLVEDGEAYDIDGAQIIPEEIVLMMGTFIETLEEYYNRMES